MFEFDVLIERKRKEATQTLGELTVYKDRVKPVFECVTMELEEDKNAVRDDCIPTGLYNVKRRYSNKYGWHFHILDVPNRTLILIHEANYSYQLLGCIGVGEKITDINRDGLDDITNSRATKKTLLSLLPDNFKLKII
jgi:hypothetical protein